MKNNKLLSEELNRMQELSGIKSELETQNSSNIPKVDLYYERYMKSYDVLENYKGLGPGTLFGGDSGYIDSYEELVNRLKRDMKNEVENIDNVEFIDTGEYLTTFIKGYAVFWH